MIANIKFLHFFFNSSLVGYMRNRLTAFKFLHLLFFILFFLTFSLTQAQNVTEAWTRKLPDSYGKKIEHDSNGDLIVLGVGDLGSSSPVSTLKIWKYDTLGTLLWTQTIIDSTGPYTTKPTALAIDSLNNIYVCAIAHDYGAPPGPAAEGLLVKLNAQGNLLWSRYYGLNVNLAAEFFDMKIYRNKYIYVAGFTAVDSISLESYLLAQYDSSGGLNWVQSMQQPFNEQFTSLQVDKIGNVYVVGFVSCCPPGWDLTLRKFDLNGNFKWRTLVNDTSAYFMDYAFSSSIDDSANIYITGKCANYNLVGIIQCSISKVDSSGQVKWYRSLHSTRQYAYRNSPNGIMLDSANNVIVFGEVAFQTPWVHEAFVGKYDKYGNKKWENFLLNDSNLSVGFNDGFISENNQINLSGGAWGYSGSNYFEGTNIYRLDDNGLFQWNYVLNNNGVISTIKFFNGSAFSAGNKWVQSVNNDSSMVCRFDFDYQTSIFQLHESGNQCLIKLDNPFHNELHIESCKPNTNVLILDLQGREVWRSNSIATLSINTSAWNNGLYFLQVQSDEKFYCRKIVKQ